MQHWRRRRRVATGAASLNLAPLCHCLQFAKRGELDPYATEEDYQEWQSDDEDEWASEGGSSSSSAAAQVRPGRAAQAGPPPKNTQLRAWSGLA